MSVLHVAAPRSIRKGWRPPRGAGEQAFAILRPTSVPISEATPAKVIQVSARSDLPMTSAQTIATANRTAATITIHLSQKSAGTDDLKSWLERDARDQRPGQALDEADRRRRRAFAASTFAQPAEIGDDEIGEGEADDRHDQSRRIGPGVRSFPLHRHTRIGIST